MQMKLSPDCNRYFSIAGLFFSVDMLSWDLHVAVYFVKPCYPWLREMTMSQFTVSVKCHSKISRKDESVS